MHACRSTLEDPTDIPLPGAQALLVPGRNVLAIEGHDASLHSTDFSLHPVLLATSVPAALPEPAVPTADVAEDAEADLHDTPEHAPVRTKPTDERVQWSTTLAAYYVSNYFERPSSAPREAVTGELVRQEVGLRLGRESRTRLVLRAEGQRVGSLGNDVALVARATWRLTPRQSLAAQVDGLWNRPALRIVTPDGLRLARTNSLTSQVAWSLDAPWPKASPLTWSAWLDFHREEVDLDSRRDARDRTLGASVRFLRRLRSFSPELGIEQSRREAGSPNFEYDQLRAFLKIRSTPSPRVYLSLLLRSTRREYSADDPLLYSNSGRHDTQRLARITSDVTLGRAFTLSAFCAVEDGNASRAGSDFSSWTGWAGVTWTP